MKASRKVCFSPPEEAWNEFARPWIEAWSARSLETARPILIVTPDPRQALDFKRRVVADGLSLWGLPVETPSAIRRRLREHYLPEAPLNPRREDVELLLATLANGEARKAPEAPSWTQQSHLLRRVWDSLELVSGSPAEVSQPAVHAILEQAQARLDEAGLCLVQALDRLLLKSAQRDSESPFEAVLLWGFTAIQHGRLMPLLHALIAASETVLALFPEPTLGEPTEAELLWRSTWSESLEEVLPQGALENPVTGYADWARYFALGTAPLETVSHQPEVIQVESQSGLLTAVLNKLIQFRTALPEESVLVLCPSGSTLPWQLSELLNQSSIPFTDAIGADTSQLGEELLRLWLEAAEGARLSPWLAFAQGLERSGRVSPEVVASLAKSFEAGARDLQSDHFPLVSAWLKLTGENELKAFLEDWIQPSEERPWAAWMEWAGQALTRFESVDVELLKERSELPALLLRDDSVPRESALSWLRQELLQPGKSRAAVGHESFARILLWPLEDGPYPCTKAIIAVDCGGDVTSLNDPVNRLTDVVTMRRRSTAPGASGEGSEKIREESGLSILDTEKESHHWTWLAEAFAPAANLAFISMPDSAGEIKRQGMLIRRTIIASGGNHHVPSVETLCSPFFLWPRTAENPNRTPEISQTAITWKLRYRGEGPYGAWNYAFSAPPPMGFTLTPRLASGWLREPVSAWWEGLLSLTPRADYRPVSLTPAGVWVHRWLALSVSDVWIQAVKQEDWIKQTEGKAEAFRELIEQTCKESGASVPESWWASWYEARYAASNILSSLSGYINSAVQVASHWRIGQNLTLPSGLSSQRACLSEEMPLTPAGSSSVDLALYDGEALHLIDWTTSKRALYPKRIAGGIAFHLFWSADWLLRHRLPVAGVGYVSDTVRHMNREKIAQHIESLHAALPLKLLTQGILGEGRGETQSDRETRKPIATIRIDEARARQRWRETQQLGASP